MAIDPYFRGMQNPSFEEGNARQESKEKGLSGFRGIRTESHFAFTNYTKFTNNPSYGKITESKLRAHIRLWKEKGGKLLPP